MKKIYLLRHAKSSWDYPELDDFERPLNKRGRRDLYIMAKVIADLSLQPDQFLSSPALRAAFTAMQIADLIGYPSDKIQFNALIYDASTTTLLNILKSLDNTLSSLLLVGHNPCLTGLANYLANKPIDNIPTCGLYGMSTKIKTWEGLSESCADFVLFEYPKRHI
jgi:phosphohistidine phosphatase